MNIANAAEWKALVYLYRGPGVSNGVRVLLLYLADHMGANPGGVGAAVHNRPRPEHL